MKKILINTFAVHLFICSGFSQSLNDEFIRSQFVNDWERAKTYTIEYLNTMPADKYSFIATDSIRSFAQQMLHLAQSNVNIFAFATGATNIIGDRILEESRAAQTKDSVMYYVVASYDLAINGLKKMNMATLSEKIKFYMWEETRFALLLKGFEHQSHHRGQSTIYIRLLGIRPPQERLF